MKKELKRSVDDFYNDGIYEKVLETGLVGVLYRYFHKTLERDISHRSDLKKILEVGAGRGQHTKFVVHDYENYILTDLRPDYIKENSLNKKVEVFNKPVDASKLPFKDDEFDRVLATCLLIHIPDSKKALEEWMRVTRHGGVISIYVPTEPSPVLRLARFLSTAKKSKKLGIDATQVHYLQHLHSWQALNAQIIQVCGNKNFKRKNYPVNLGFDFSLWSIYQINVVKDY